MEAEDLAFHKYLEFHRWDTSQMGLMVEERAQEMTSEMEVVSIEEKKVQNQDLRV